MAEKNVSTEEKKSAEEPARFVIQKIYTKDISFETPNTPGIFREEWQPELDLQLTNEYRRIDDDNHEITLIVTVTAKVGDKVAFLVEVKQAGVFSLTGYSDQEMGPLVGSYCPNTLFPFAREVVSDIVLKGGFPQLVLAPVNFDALYMNQIEQAKQKAAAAKTTH
ncbi:MAG: protein-export chaperone SecB [Methylophaga sp.]|nr:MAG: protein-export chaperone SecB [Methylophaga sp.]